MLNNLRVLVTNIETNESTEYHGIRPAARALNINKTSIMNYIYLPDKKPVLNKYIFKLLEVNKIIKPQNQTTAIKIEVLNIETNEKKIYDTIGIAARDLGLRQSSISLYIKNNNKNKEKKTPFKNLYHITVL